MSFHVHISGYIFNLFIFQAAMYNISSHLGMEIIQFAHDNTYTLALFLTQKLNRIGQ